MSLETPCLLVWFCQDFAIAVETVDRFIPQVPTLARRRCQCACAALGAGETGPVTKTTARFLSPARFVTTACVALSPSTRPIKDHGSIKSTSETCVTLSSPTIGTQAAAAAALAAAADPCACLLAYRQSEPSNLAAEADRDLGAVLTGPGLLQEPGLARLGLDASLASRATRILACATNGALLRAGNDRVWHGRNVVSL